MASMTIRLSLALAMLALIFPTVANAGATLVSPADGATVPLTATGSVKPAYGWVVPTGESSYLLSAGTSPALDSDGRLANYDLHFELFSDNVSSFVSSGVPAAGRYYWQIETDIADSFTKAWSPVWSFVVPKWFGFSSTPWSVTRDEGSTNLQFTYTANGNVRVVSTLQLYHGTKRVGFYRNADFVSSAGSEETEYETWYRPSTVPRNRRIKAIVTIASGGKAKRIVRFFQSS